MTTQVKVIHNGGNHKVKVQVLTGDPRVRDAETVARETVLEKAGDEYAEYVYGGQVLKVIEVDD